MTKQTAINIIENIIDKINQKHPTDWEPRDRDAFLFALACINEINVPKVEECEVIDPSIHGHEDCDDLPYCSFCRHEFCGCIEEKFCPSCGHKIKKRS